MSHISHVIWHYYALQIRFPCVAPLIIARTLVQLDESTARSGRSAKDDVYLPAITTKASSLNSLRGALSQSCPYLYDKRRGSLSSVTSQRTGSLPKKQVIWHLFKHIEASCQSQTPLCSFHRPLFVSERLEGQKRSKEVQRHRDDDLPGTRPSGGRVGIDSGRTEDTAASQRRGEYLCLQRPGDSGR